MEIYIVIFILLSFLSILKKKDAIKPIYIFFVVLLIIISGFKGKNVGFDYDNYAINMIRDGEMDLLEPGFVFLLKAFRPLKDVTFFFLFIATISITLKSTIIYKYSYYPMLSLLLYFCIAYIMNDLGQIRYGLSMSLMLVALIKLAKAEWKKYWIISAFAVAIHYSALCAIPVALLIKYRFTIKQVTLLCVLFSVFTIITIEPLLLGAMRFIPISHLNDKIVEYVLSEAVDPLGFNMSLLLRLFFLYMFYHYIGLHHRKSFFLNALFNMYLYGILWYMLFNSVSEFATRGSGFFKILDLLVIPYIINFSRGAIIRMGILLLAILYSAYSLQKILLDPLFSTSYVPYRSVLF